MPGDEDLYDDIEDTDADDMDDEKDTDDEGDEPEGVMGKLTKLSECLGELGIVVDPGKDVEEYVEHLLTAVETHKATKGKHGGGDNPDEDDMAGDKKPIEEPQAVAMSRQLSQLQEEVKAQKGRADRFEKAAADERFKSVTAEIDGLVGSGKLKPASADAFKKTLAAKKVALLGHGDVEVERVLAKVEAAHDIDEGHYWDADQKSRHTAAREEKKPAHAEFSHGEDKDGLTPEKREEILDFMWGPRKAK